MLSLITQDWISLAVCELTCRVLSPLWFAGNVVKDAYYKEGIAPCDVAIFLSPEFSISYYRNFLKIAQPRMVIIFIHEPSMQFRYGGKQGLVQWGVGEGPGANRGPPDLVTRRGLHLGTWPYATWTWPYILFEPRVQHFLLP